MLLGGAKSSAVTALINGDEQPLDLWTSVSSLLCMLNPPPASVS